MNFVIHGLYWTVSHCFYVAYSIYLRPNSYIFQQCYMINRIVILIFPYLSPVPYLNFGFLSIMTRVAAERLFRKVGCCLVYQDLIWNLSFPFLPINFITVINRIKLTKPNRVRSIRLSLSASSASGLKQELAFTMVIEISQLQHHCLFLLLLDKKVL